MVAVAAVVAKALAAVVPLRLDGYDAAMEDPLSSEQPRSLMYKVASPPQVVETFEWLGGIRPVDMLCRTSAVVRGWRAKPPISLSTSFMMAGLLCSPSCRRLEAVLRGLLLASTVGGVAGLGDITLPSSPWDSRRR